MTKLFVGGLPFAMNDQTLTDLFTPHGQVASAQVITDKFSGRSRGFGFVEMANDGEAQTAIQALNGSTVDGRQIVVSVARPREERSERSFGDRRHSGGRDFRSRDHR